MSNTEVARSIQALTLWFCTIEPRGEEEEEEEEEEAHGEAGSSSTLDPRLAPRFRKLAAGRRRFAAASNSHHKTSDWKAAACHFHPHPTDRTAAVESLDLCDVRLSSSVAQSRTSFAYFHHIHGLAADDRHYQHRTIYKKGRQPHLLTHIRPPTTFLSLPSQLQSQISYNCNPPSIGSPVPSHTTSSQLRR